MTDENFNKGFKTLTRFLKDQGKYQAFKNITVKYFKNNGEECSYKTYLKHKFDLNHHTWWRFFDFTYYVGEDYRNYEDPGLTNLRNEWHKLIENTNLQ